MDGSSCPLNGCREATGQQDVSGYNFFIWATVDAGEMNNDVCRCDEVIETFGGLEDAATTANQLRIRVAMKVATQVPANEPIGSGDGNGHHEE
jgi:hypothetical protein